jgi:hypothetical protein
VIELRLQTIKRIKLESKLAMGAAGMVLGYAQLSHQSCFVMLVMLVTYEKNQMISCMCEKYCLKVNNWGCLRK